MSKTRFDDWDQRRKYVSIPSRVIDRRPHLTGSVPYTHNAIPIILNRSPIISLMELLGFLFSALWMCYIAGLMILWTNYYGFLASVASAGSVVFALFLFWQMSKVVRVLSGVWRK